MNKKRERPRDSAGWDRIYIDGEMRWDTGQPDQYLPSVIDQYRIKPGKALEIGCGTGTNSIWLAGQGFEVTGLDISQTAIGMAESKAATAGVECNFLVADILADSIAGAPFNFVYDRGCLHVFDTAEDRSHLASRVGELIAPEGIWHSLIGSTDGPPRKTGPPRQSATEIVKAVEPHFEILELRSTMYDPEHNLQARAWLLVAQRREFYPA